MKPSISELRSYYDNGQLEEGATDSTALAELLAAVPDLLATATAALNFANARHADAPTDELARCMATVASAGRRFES